MFLLWMQTFSETLWFDGNFSKLTLVYRGWLSCIFFVGTRYVKIVSTVQLSFLHLRNANVDISTCLQWGDSRTPASWGAWNYYLNFCYENVQSDRKMTEQYSEASCNHPPASTILKRHNLFLPLPTSLYLFRPDWFILKQISNIISFHPHKCQYVFLKDKNS